MLNFDPPPIEPAGRPPARHELRRRREAERIALRVMLMREACAAQASANRGAVQMSGASIWLLATRAIIWLVMLGWSIVFWPFAWSRKPALGVRRWELGKKPAMIPPTPNAQPPTSDCPAQEVRELAMQMRRAVETLDDDPAWRERVFLLIEDPDDPGLPVSDLTSVAPQTKKARRESPG